MTEGLTVGPGGTTSLRRLDGLSLWPRGVAVKSDRQKG